MPFSFKINAKQRGTRARAGTLITEHGKLQTPYVIPVATRANVIALAEKDIRALKIKALLANTYHLNLRPGDQIIKSKGGLHKFMNFPHVIFTDSGGFQAFSLGLGREQGARKIGFIPGKKIAVNSKDKFVKINSKGVWFTSVYDNSRRFMGPKESMQIQSNLGADVIMAFDECTSAFSTKADISKAMERSHKWESQSLKYYNPEQALYGIVHGGWFKDLRIKSAQYINSLPFQGIAIGGSLGKSKSNMKKILDWTIPSLDDRPRHMLGIGWIDDIFECVERGIDTFDCVEMTRIARHGHLYISPESGGSIKNKFRISIRNHQYINDSSPIDKKCKCSTCKRYGRKQLRQLCKARDPLYGRLATIHNIYFVHALVKEIRNSIIKNKFPALKKKWIKTGA